MIVDMNKQLILKQLIDIGLEEIEANVYFHLLENGPRTHLQLSRETSIDRSKIYRYVEKLIKKNLIIESNDAWGKKLQAAKPGNIEQLLEKKGEILRLQKEVAPILINELNNLPSYNQREIEIKNYRGSEGLKQMLWNQLSAKKELLAFSYKNRNDIVGESFAEKVRAEQVERKITLYEVENETDQGNYWYTKVENWNKFYKSRFISPKILTIRQHISIFNDTVAIINWLNEEQVGLEITHSFYAKMQKQIFWKFWEIAKKAKNQ